MNCVQYVALFLGCLLSYFVGPPPPPVWDLLTIWCKSDGIWSFVNNDRFIKSNDLLHYGLMRYCIVISQWIAVNTCQNNKVKLG